MSKVDWGSHAVAQCAQLHPYIPGKPVEMLLAEQGITEAIKLASNENPYGPPPAAIAAIREHAGGVSRYPDGDSRALKKLLAAIHGVTANEIIIGNGSSEILELVIRTFAGAGDEVVFSSRAFIMYPLYTRAVGATGISVPEADGLTHDLDMMAAAVNERTKVLCIANPNNPTGTVHSYSAIQQMLDQLPRHLVVLLDEAYIEYMHERDRQGSLNHPGLVICRTFSKAFGLAGCRIGYGVADAGLLSLVNRFRPPFNTGNLSQAAAIAALGDTDWVLERVAESKRERTLLEDFFDSIGLLACRSAANFVLIRHDLSDWLLLELEQRGIIPRPLKPYGMENYLRITVGTASENAQLITAMKTILG